LLSRKTDGDLDLEGRHAMEFVLTHSRKLHSMVRGLLAWVRAVDTQAESMPSCSGDQVIDEVIKLNEAAIAAHKVVIDTGHGLPVLNMHPRHAREIFDQLIRNAIQFGNRDPLKISICAQRLEESWKICVHDTGTGIPTEMQSRIFGVFRHLNAAGHGIGMGLAICRRIVDYYGGRIWVESTQGQGCTFCFTVPDGAPARVRRIPFLRLPGLTQTENHAHSDR
jgi:light-regulated signal transduction histidine kinase (bacteriophytochrome)